LAPLARDDLRQLIADALRCEPMGAAPLAQLVHEKTAGNPFPFPLRAAFTKGLAVQAYASELVVTSAPATLERGKRFDGLAAGTFKPVIAKTFPLDRIVEAHRYLESNQQVGKIIVTI
jgi:NADPH2:quinone reductase